MSARGQLMRPDGGESQQSVRPAAMAVQMALLRQPWQPRGRETGWRRPWVPLAVHALAAGGLLVLWPAQWRWWLGALGLIALAWVWWLQAEGLHRQNRPSLSRLVPGHVRALQVQLVMSGALVTAAAVAVLTVVLGPLRPWLWLVLPVVVLMAWLSREPWLWLLLCLVGPWVPLHAGAVEAAAAAPGLKLLALLVAAAVLAASIGRGGRLHRWQAARCARWQQVEAAQREGRAAPPSPPGLAGSLGRAFTRFFGWPRLLWRRRVLAQGAAAPLPARLDLGLGCGGQWPELLWTAVVLFGGLALNLWSIGLRNPDVDLQATADFSRFGLCVGAFSMIASTLYGRQGRLWGRRREQALLVLLPGVPAADLGEQERRWRREYLLAWLPAAALVLAVGAAGSPGSLDYTAACAAMCLPLAWLAQHQHRRQQGRPRPALLALAPVLAAALAWPVQMLGVPAWLSLALGAAAYAALAWRHDAQRLVLPLGRAGAA